MLNREAANTKFYNLWFDPTGARPHDLPHANHYPTDIHVYYMILCM